MCVKIISHHFPLWPSGNQQKSAKTNLRTILDRYPEPKIEKQYPHFRVKHRQSSPTQPLPTTALITTGSHCFQC